MHDITTLENGLRLVSRHMPDNDSVSVAFFVGSGGRYEDLKTEYGAAHFIEHLLFKGSAKRPSPKQIVEEIDSVGGHMNAYTAEDHTSYYIKLPAKHLGLAFDVLSDTLTRPLFDPTEIERERSVILEEMNVYRDDPYRYVFDLVGPLLWPEDGLRSNIIGDEAIISAMPREVIKNYFDQLYTMDNTVISVAGNILHSQVLNLANQLLGRETSRASRHFQSVQGGLLADGVMTIDQDTNQSHMVLCGRGAALGSDDEMPLKLLATILGGGMSSRLSLSVREQKGLAYTIYMSTTGYVDTGKFEIYTGVSRDKTEDALRAIIEELHQVQEHIVPEREMEKAKEQMRGRLIMGLESNSAVADRMGTQLIVRGRVTTLRESIERIDRITAEEVLLAARKYLQPDNMRLALIGRFDEPAKASLTNIIHTR